MDWNLAIEINRAALKRIVAMLVAMAGFAGTAVVTPAGQSDDCGPLLEGGRRVLPRHLHRAVLRLLRPAESAARRLVIATAREMLVASAAGYPAPLASAPACPDLHAAHLGSRLHPAVTDSAAGGARRSGRCNTACPAVAGARTGAGRPAGPSQALRPLAPPRRRTRAGKGSRSARRSRQGGGRRVVAPPLPGRRTRRKNAHENHSLLAAAHGPAAGLAAQGPA